MELSNLNFIMAGKFYIPNSNCLKICFLSFIEIQHNSLKKFKVHLEGVRARSTFRWAHHRAITSPVTALRPYNWAVKSRIGSVLDLIWAEPIEAIGLFSVDLRRPKTGNPKASTTPLCYIRNDHLYIFKKK